MGGLRFCGKSSESRFRQRGKHHGKRGNPSWHFFLF